MKNHLRSGFYLLVRNPYVWVALALVVARWAWTLAGVAQGSVSFGLQDSILRDKVTLAVYVFSAAGIAAFDQRGRALRSSCEAEGGRARYATSRFVMVAVGALALVAATAALDLLGGALVPGASRILASPQMHEPLRLAAGILTVLVACELAFFVGALVRSPSALATVACSRCSTCSSTWRSSSWSPTAKSRSSRPGSSTPWARSCPPRVSQRASPLRRRPVSCRSSWCRPL